MDNEPTNTSRNRTAVLADSAAKDHGHWSGHVWRVANVCFSAMAWSSLLAIVWAIVPNLYRDPQKLAFIENCIAALCISVIFLAWSGLFAEYTKSRVALANRQSKGRMLACFEHALPVLYAVIAVGLGFVLASLVAFVKIGESGLNGPITQAATVSSAQRPATQAFGPSLAAQCCCCCPGMKIKGKDGPLDEHRESSPPDDCARDARVALHFERGCLTTNSKLAKGESPLLRARKSIPRERT